MMMNDYLISKRIDLKPKTVIDSFPNQLEIDIDGFVTPKTIRKHSCKTPTKSNLLSSLKLNELFCNSSIEINITATY